MIVMKKKNTKSSHHTGRRPRPEQDNASPSPEPMPRIMMEKTLNDIGKLLESKDFKSIDEANAYLQGLLANGGQIPHTEPETPLERAQELVYQAHEARTAAKRGELARQALLISPDCADAYNLLAELESSPHKRLALFEQGMVAGERAIGPDQFREWEGDFWGITETRPYMRACAGVAEMSWVLGQRSRAIDLYQHMLRLNPNDNQGVRYMLSNYLLEVGNDAALTKLLEQFEDDAAANWAYSRALSLFRTQGNGPAARKALALAIKANGFVPPYLLGTKHLPRHLPDYVGFGDESEAIAYAAYAIPAWTQSPGALDWLLHSQAPNTHISERGH